MPNTAIADIKPCEADFTRAQLLAAERIAREDPGKLTDRDLSYLATYDADYARRAAEARDCARAARAAEAPPTPAPTAAKPLVGVLVEPKGFGASDFGPRDDEETGAWIRRVTMGNPSRTQGFQALSVLFATLTEVVKELKQKIANLEKAGPAVHYEGVWTEGRAYGLGSLATRSGSLWLAKQATCATPGAGTSDWQLIVKKGEA
jgi:hypothetical protein